METALQGVGLGDAVSVASNLDGRLEAFAVGTDFGLYHNWQVSPGVAWSGWNQLGNVLTSEPAVARNLDGRLEVFARGIDGAWSAWSSLSGVITSDPVVGQNNDGRLEVFARGTDNAVWHIWKLATGGWSAWNTLGGAAAWTRSASTMTVTGAALPIFQRERLSTL